LMPPICRCCGYKDDALDAGVRLSDEEEAEAQRLYRELCEDVAAGRVLWAGTHSDMAISKTKAPPAADAGEGGDADPICDHTGICRSTASDIEKDEAVSSCQHCGRELILRDPDAGEVEPC
jgi:hypothetical protein